MATQAHCAFCFETLTAAFEHRTPLSLVRTEELWDQYQESGSSSNEVDDEDAEMTEADEPAATSTKRTALSRLLNREPAPSAGSSTSSLPGSAKSGSSGSSGGSGGSVDVSGNATPASSVSSKSSDLSRGKGGVSPPSEYPLFVTWNTVSKSGHKSLRGCIGTFQAQELESGLSSYAVTSAFEDTRFSPIPSALLPSLSVEVTLLTNFSSPSRDALAWTLGKHGIRISFTHHGRRYGSTYLPSVAVEQEWTKEETLISLMRKAGWNGSSSKWEKVWRDGRGEVVTYEGEKVGLGYAEWKQWRDWVDRLES